MRSRRLLFLWGWGVVRKAGNNKEEIRYLLWNVLPSCADWSLLFCVRINCRRRLWGVTLSPAPSCLTTAFQMTDDMRGRSSTICFCWLSHLLQKREIKKRKWTTKINSVIINCQKNKGITILCMDIFWYSRDFGVLAFVLREGISKNFKHFLYFIGISSKKKDLPILKDELISLVEYAFSWERARLFPQHRKL